MQLLLGGNVYIFIKHEKMIENEYNIDEKEWAVARWTFDRRKPAGWTTETLSSAAALYLPLVAKEEIVGVFAYSRENRSKNLSFEDENLLTAIARHIALYFENELYKERAMQRKRDDAK